MVIGDNRLEVVTALLLALTASNVQGFLSLNPPELLVREGDTAMFTCSPLYFVARPILEWNGVVFDSDRLTYSDHAIDSPEGRRVYSLFNVTREESGATLRCNTAGYFSNTVTLNVFVFPTVTGPSGEVTMIEGDPSYQLLSYVIEGFPHPHTVHWLYNGLQFSGGPGVGVVNQTSLVVQAPHRNNSGSYTLIVGSPVGMTTISVTLRIVYNEFIEYPYDVTMASGGMVKLHCLHQFGWAYAWFSDQRPLHQNADKVLLLETGQLLVYGPVDYHDHGLRIYCVVHIRHTDTLFRSPPATLSVQSPPVVLAPPPLTVTEGSDVFLEFDVRGHPPPSQTHYLHNNHTLMSGRRMGIHGLELNGVSRESAGDYTLTATNSLGSASNTTRLEVLYAPMVLHRNEAVIGQLFRPINLPCGRGYYGNPTPEISWTRMTSNDITQHNIDKTTGALRLPTVDSSNEGPYQCTVSNALGTATTRVNLLLLDPPSQPLNLSVSTIGSTWVVVNWTAPIASGHNPVSGYMVTVNISLVNNQNGDCVEVICESMEVWVETTSANVSDLVPGVKHVIVVRALSNGTNLQSPPSTELEVTTHPSVPSIGGVSAIASGPGMSVVNWTLAYTGGTPLTHYTIQLRQASDTQWRDVGSINSLTQYNISSAAKVPSGQRSWQVGGLEGDEPYFFQVAGVNAIGRGLFVATPNPIMSHPKGVPSQPEQPSVTSVDVEGVCLSTQEWAEPVNLVVLVGVGDEVYFTRVFSGYRGSEVIISNISYQGNLVFRLVTANNVGFSEPSPPSLPAKDYVMETRLVTVEIAGPVIGAIVGVVNCVVMVITMAMCVGMCRELNHSTPPIRSNAMSHCQQVSNSLISSRMMFLNNFSHSSDTHTSSELTPSTSSMVRRRPDRLVTIVPPTPLSSVTMV